MHLYHPSYCTDINSYEVILLLINEDEEVQYSDVKTEHISLRQQEFQKHRSDDDFRIRKKKLKADDLIFVNQAIE